MKTLRPSLHKQTFCRQAGFTLIELMIASAIGLVILAALSYVLVSNIISRNELDKNSAQMENGRYALATLADEIQLAGFYGEYFPSSTGLTTPDPCSRVLQDMGFAAANYRWNTTAVAKVPVGLYGYTSSDTLPSTCNTYITNRAPNTDVLVVRRASTTPIVIDANADNTADANVTMEDGSSATYASLGNAFYLQGSNCNDAAFAAESAFIMDHDTSRFTLHKAKEGGSPKSCMNGTFNLLRKYMVRIFYIRSCSNCAGSGDGVPTLVMVELTPDASVCTADTTTDCGNLTARPIAEGIERMHFEYGIDSNIDGVPDTYKAAPASTEWENAMSVKIFLLARNKEQTIGYVNDKTYLLNSTGTAMTVTPNDNFKRHLYSATATATNLSGRRP